ncbi:hypothetical protein E2320_005449 [Naja naja]|nr:hypothetical protein E2320_005449 [Naja naja]
MAEDAKSPRKDEFFIIFQVGAQLQNFIQLLLEESVLKLESPKLLDRIYCSCETEGRNYICIRTMLELSIRENYVNFQSLNDSKISLCLHLHFYFPLFYVLALK